MVITWVKGLDYCGTFYSTHAFSVSAYRAYARQEMSWLIELLLRTTTGLLCMYTSEIGNLSSNKKVPDELLGK